MAWGDTSGIDAGFSNFGWTPNAAGGYVGITGFNITNLRIKARETDNYGTGYPSAPYGGAWGTAFLKPITIDVATGNKVASGGTTISTFVRFGLGSLQITLDAMTFTVALGDTTLLDNVMGTVNLGAMGIYINPTSYVDIFAHQGTTGLATGVSMDMNIVVDRFNMTYVSWGDPDGLAGGNPGVAGGIGGGYWIAPGTTNTAGYIGLENLVVGGPIMISGTVAIDVVTSALGVYAAHPVAGGTTVTVCHISFPRLFTVMVTGPITANVKLDSAGALNSASAGTLGDIYISGFNLGIVGGSWVDIWAH
jgi:hypothetical protein